MTWKRTQAGRRLHDALPAGVACRVQDARILVLPVANSLDKVLHVRVKVKFESGRTMDIVDTSPTYPSEDLILKITMGS